MDGKKNIVLGISGGIAAYKSADLVSRFIKSGLVVHVIMTKNATRFITPLTLETLSNNAVAEDTFAEKQHHDIEHISLAKRADVFVIAPATANIIAKMANGIADDMLSTTVLATKAPILIAPAMNENMWDNPATQHNITILKGRGVHFVGPGKGLLACGDYGYGRMEKPPAILEAALDLLESNKDFAGKKVIITAGPTQEAIDPVRYITNRSSGKMGFELARAAKRRGADVALVHGPVSLDVPAGVEVIPVRTTLQMLSAILNIFDTADIVIKAAAPADFRPEQASSSKIKKAGKTGLSLQLSANPDILTELSTRRKGQLLVGFAAESDNVQGYAMEKLARKGLDMIVANDISAEGAGFAVDTNAVAVYKQNGYSRVYDNDTKFNIANRVLDEISLLLGDNLQ